MRQGDIVKHVCCLDVGFYINKVQYRGPNYWKVRGVWVNLTSASKYVIHYQPETIKISAAERSKWKVVEI
jgi:hypothetical protein